MKRIPALLLSALVATATAWCQSVPFFDTSKPHNNPINVEVHVLSGITTTTQNYSSIPGVERVSANPGWGKGFGTEVQFVLRQYLALTTGLDFLWGRDTADLTMIDDGTQAVSDVYLTNTNLYLRFPIGMAIRLNLGDKVQWISSAGIYLAVGLWGHQQADIYSTDLNSLGQMVTTQYKERWNYFNGDGGLIHTTHRYDCGLMLSSGIRAFGHYTVGMQFTYGFKDTAKALGPLREIHTHNLDFMLRLGYNFR